MLLVCKFMVGGLQNRGAVGMQVHGGGDSSIEMLLVCKFMVGGLQYRGAVGMQVHGGGTPV